MMNDTVARFFAVVIACVCATHPSHAAGKNLVYKNPNPDRTWTSQAGGILTPAKSYALVISISDYIGTEAGGYSKLDTHNDAEKMKDFLLQDMGFDYVRVITDTEVTKPTLEKIMLDEIPKMVGQHDRFVFYWSGHGDQLVKSDKSAFGFLPLYDSRIGQFSSMIGMEDIARWNGYLEARHALFILDSCLSGLAGLNKKSNPRAEFSLPARFLMTAGTAKEEVIAADRWGGSLFTDALIKVVKEHAQATGALISIYRVFDELQERVSAEKLKAHYAKPLTPQLRDLQGGDGAFFFVAKALATVPATLESKSVEEESLSTVNSVRDPNLSSNGGRPPGNTFVDRFDRSRFRAGLPGLQADRFTPYGEGAVVPTPKSDTIATPRQSSNEFAKTVEQPENVPAGQPGSSIFKSDPSSATPLLDGSTPFPPAHNHSSGPKTPQDVHSALGNPQKSAAPAVVRPKLPAIARHGPSSSPELSEGDPRYGRPGGPSAKCFMFNGEKVCD
jgi:hypothetical protein